MFSNKKNKSFRFVSICLTVSLFFVLSLKQTQVIFILLRVLTGTIPEKDNK